MASGRFKAFRGANKITFDYSIDCDITVKAYLSNFLWDFFFFFEFCEATVEEFTYMYSS